MAEGRMLKRNISESRRLSELKTDSARLLWTWIIPFLDSAGRFYASTDMIKGKVVPRIKTFTEKNIPSYINDMARVGLITLYDVDGEKLMQYRKFEVFQNIKAEREAPPLPAPTTQDLLQTYSGVNQDELQTNSRLPFPNINEVNINKDIGSNSGPTPKKICFLDCVFLYEKEFEKLKAEHGEKLTSEIIKTLNDYKMASGKKYKSDYHAILNWVVEKVKTKSGNGNQKPGPSSASHQESPYTNCPSCHREVLESDLEGFGCIKCITPKVDVKQLLNGIGKRI